MEDRAESSLLGSVEIILKRLENLNSEKETLKQYIDILPVNANVFCFVDFDDDTTCLTNKYDVPFAPFVGVKSDLVCLQKKQQRITYGYSRLG